MKSFAKLFIIGALALAGFTAQAAQTKDSVGNIQDQIAFRQAQSIADKLSLDVPTKLKFIEVFVACQKEIRAAKPAVNKNVNTETAAREAIKAQFDHSQKILDIRKKYYKEYSKILTQQQIYKLNSLERYNFSTTRKQHKEKNKLKAEQRKLKAEKRKLERKKSELARKQKEIERKRQRTE